MQPQEWHETRQATSDKRQAASGKRQAASKEPGWSGSPRVVRTLSAEHLSWNQQAKTESRSDSGCSCSNSASCRSVTVRSGDSHALSCPATPATRARRQQRRNEALLMFARSTTSHDTCAICLSQYSRSSGRVNEPHCLHTTDSGRGRTNQNDQGKEARLNGKQAYASEGAESLPA